MKHISFNPRFVNAAGDDLIPGKIHTIRQNYDWWKRWEGKEVALFTWDGKPYQPGSKHKVFCVKRIVSVQKIRKRKHYFWSDTFVMILGDTWEDDWVNAPTMAKNDGFENVAEIYNWFKNDPDGEKAIIHFPLDIKENDVITRGICEHRDTMEAAAIAAIEALRGKVLVSRAGGEIKDIYFYLPEEIYNGQST